MSSREVPLASGAVLHLQEAPFSEAKALYQAVLDELKPVRLNSHESNFDFFKDVACYAFSSPKIERALDKCLERCRYNEFKIDKNTFEGSGPRKDYVEVCILVAKENLEPFFQSLFAGWKQFSDLTEKVPA